MPMDCCPLCEEGAPEFFWGSVWNAPGKQVMRCGSCGSFILNPLESEDDQRKFDASYHEYIRARSELVSKHTQRTFDASVDDSIESRFQDLKQFLAGRSSILEIGAEKGGFLDRIDGSVAFRAAVDACPEYVDILKAKGYETYPYVWDVLPQKIFDLVCFFSLLEHIPYPQSFLQRAASHLASDGLMIIEVPSANEPLLSLYDLPAFKSFYFQAMHPYVYSEKAVSKLLARCGLEVDQVLYKQRYGLANHLQWLKNGTPGGNEYFSTIFAGPADEGYIRALEATGCTDTLYIVARKA